MMKRAIFAAAVLAGAWAWAAAPAGLIRHWKFDEGEGNEVGNLVDVEPGKRAVTGGKLGSLEILYTTHYGVDTGGSYWNSRTTDVETVWCEGREPGTSALRVGVRPTGLFRSGITGKEFGKGMTICGWIKFEERGVPCSAYPLRLGTGVCDDGFLLKWEKNGWAKKGRLTFVQGRTRKDGHARNAAPAAKECESGEWHAFGCTVDGKKARLYLDGEMHEAETDTQVISKFKGGTWTGGSPFVGGTDIGCLKVGAIMDFRTPVAPFTLGGLAVFDRALGEGEIEEFLGVKGKREELFGEAARARQRAASAAEAKAREAREKITMELPRDSNGYFRSGEEIPVRVENAPAGSVLRMKFETIDGEERFRKEVPTGADGRLEWKFREEKCDAYNLYLELAGADGKVLKREARPWVVGIVPKAPDHLNSPFGWWAMNEAFNYDSNLRRNCAYWAPWLKGVATNEFVRNHGMFIKRQKIREDELREFCFLPYECGLKLPQGHKLTAKERDFLKGCYGQVLKAMAPYGAKEFEVSGEVDGHTTPDVYVQLLAIWKETMDEHYPGGYKMYPPGATPCALPFISKVLELGAAKYVDGVSHHNYLSNPIHSYYWDNPGKRLAEIAEKQGKAAGRKIRMYNTESGIFSLPYVNNRPMGREHARCIKYPISHIGGYETYNTSMPVLPDGEAAAVQAHAVMVNLLSGYEMYVKCQTPIRGGLPCKQGVALTALSGQVLNDMKTIREVKLSSVKALAALVGREHPRTKEKTNCLAVFAMEGRTFSFKVEPRGEYRTMDVLGNFGVAKADGAGVLAVEAKLDPVYIFGVPDGVEELSALKLEIPGVLEEEGKMAGKVTVENPFGDEYAGRLEVVAPKGSATDLGVRELRLKPGERVELPFTLTATGLKRRNYQLAARMGKLAAEATFESRGTVTVIPRVEGPFSLDGEEGKWAGVPEATCETEDDVVHGKPNFAELWLPQWGNRDDLSFRARVCYVRDDAIYFRLDARDQSVTPAPEGQRSLAFLYDCLELFVDTRTGKSLGAAADDGADQAIVPVVGGRELGRSGLWQARKGRTHVDVEVVGRATDGGWMLEGRIRPNGKSALRVRPGSVLLMDFLVDDCDEVGVKRKSAMALHGTLNNNSDVSKWGKYELGK